MLDEKNLIALAKATAKADRNAPVAYSYEDKKFSYDQVNETLRSELKELVGTPAKYRENKNILFALVEEVIGERVPVRLADLYADLAEVKEFKQGDKPVFRRKINNRTRAKQFITRVGLAGVYEVFKLGGSESFEVKTSAVGGAAQIGLEEFLDGRVDFAELIEIVMDGIEETIQLEVGQAMKTSLNQLPTNNKVENTKFEEAEFDRLLSIADSYGKATIYCDIRFAATMMPAEITMRTEKMKEELWEKGYLGSYKGHPVVILPNGVMDESNSTLVNDPSICWIVPTGSNDKPVRIAVEGATQVDERTNADWSKDVHVYKKVGVSVMLTSDICTYKNTSLTTDLSGN